MVQCKNIDKADVISFNVFDTLILSPYKDIQDLWQHLEYSYTQRGEKKAVGFFEARKKAQFLYEQNGSEGDIGVSLDPIYQYLDSKYQFFQSVELEWVSEVYTVNPLIYVLYDKAFNDGKKIIFVADTHLPLQVVKDILKKAGYNAHNTYVSSEVILNKKGGSLFDSVRGDFPNDVILHIGSDLKKDVINAQLWGLEGQYYPKPRDIFLSQSSVSPFLKGISRIEDFSAGIIVGLAVIQWVRSDGLPKTLSEKSKMFGKTEAWSTVMGFMNKIHLMAEKFGKNVCLLTFNNEYIGSTYKELYPECDVISINASDRMSFLLKRHDNLEKLYDDLLSEHVDAKREDNAQKLYNFLGLDIPKLLEELISLEISSNANSIKKLFKQTLGKYEEQISSLLLGEISNYKKYLQDLFLSENAENFIIINSAASEVVEDPIFQYLREIRLEQGGSLQKINFIQSNESSKSNENNYFLSREDWKNITKSSASSCSLFELFFSNLALHKSSDCATLADVHEKIQEGVREAIKLYKKIYGKHFIPINQSLLRVQQDCIQSNMNHSAYSWLADLKKTDGRFFIEACKYSTPGIVVPYVWGDSPSGELELIRKIQAITKHGGLPVHMVSEKKFVFDECGKVTSLRLNRNSINSIIHLELHFTSFKDIDALSLMALVNPPEFIADWIWADRNLSNFFKTHDVFLYNGSDDNAEYVKRFVENKGLFPLDWVFYPSCSEKEMFPPSDFTSPEVYYAATNWDLYSDSEKRYNSLLFLLDNSDIPCGFYGPSKVGSHSSWRGIKNYRGLIPFDGKSIFRVLNKMGISICFSSELHRLHSSVSSRLYEAIGGGSVAIVDHNQFIKDKFKDTVYYVDTTLSPKLVLEQIKNHVDEIRSNPQLATQKVLEAQDIMRREFTFEKQIEHWVSNLDQAKKAVHDMTSSKTTQVVDVVLIILVPSDLDRVQVAITNIRRQSFNKIRILAVYDQAYELTMLNLLNVDDAPNLELMHLPLNIFRKDQSRIMYLGNILTTISKNITSDYFYIYVVDEHTNYDLYHNHITTLVRTLEDNSGAMAAIGTGSLETLEDNQITINTPKLPEDIHDIISERALQANTLFNKKIFKDPKIFFLRYADSFSVLYMLLLCDDEQIVFSRHSTSEISLSGKYMPDSLFRYKGQQERVFVENMSNKKVNIHLDYYFYFNANDKKIKRLIKKLYYIIDQKNKNVYVKKIAMKVLRIYRFLRTV